MEGGGKIIMSLLSSEKVSIMYVTHSTNTLGSTIKPVHCCLCLCIYYLFIYFAHLFSSLLTCAFLL